MPVHQPPIRSNPYQNHEGECRNVPNVQQWIQCQGTEIHHRNIRVHEPKWSSTQQSSLFPWGWQHQGSQLQGLQDSANHASDSDYPTLRPCKLPVTPCKGSMKPHLIQQTWPPLLRNRDIKDVLASSSKWRFSSPLLIMALTVMMMPQ